jgi:hypothetical protein
MLTMVLTMALTGLAACAFAIAILEILAAKARRQT